VSAFEYPRQYGPRSPSFSRAVLTENNTLLVSGTASILGHESVHDSELMNQATETAANINALCEAALATLDTTDSFKHSKLRIYIRNPEDHDPAIAGLHSLLVDNTDYVVLVGDICRSNLLLEVEAVYQVGAE